MPSPAPYQAPQTPSADAYAFYPSISLSNSHVFHPSAKSRCVRLNFMHVPTLRQLYSTSLKFSPQFIFFHLLYFFFLCSLIFIHSVESQRKLSTCDGFQLIKFSSLKLLLLQMLFLNNLSYGAMLDIFFWNSRNRCR